MPTEPMGVSFTSVDREGCRIVRLEGDIDLLMSGAQERQFIDLVAAAPGNAVVADLSEVAFCDSTGLSILIKAAKRLWEDDGTFRLAAPQPHVARVLDTAGMNAVLPVFASVEAAVSADGGGSPR